MFCVTTQRHTTTGSKTVHSPRFRPESDGGPWSADQGATGLQLPPWERRERYGFLNALFLTVKDVLLSPGRFFRQMPSAVGLKEPLMFAIVVGVMASFVAWLWSITGSSLQILFRGHGGWSLKEPLYAFFTFLLSPLLVVISTFIQAGFIHLMLMLFNGDRLGFEATFRVCAYAGAASLLVVIPFCGNGIAVIWSMVIVVIGTAAIHQTEPWKAVVAVILPMVFCLSVFGGGMAMVILANS